MFANLNGWHLLILLAVILLLFGAAKLPGLAKSVGQSARILKGEMRTSTTTPDDDGDPGAPGIARAADATAPPRPSS